MQKASCKSALFLSLALVGGTPEEFPKFPAACPKADRAARAHCRKEEGRLKSA